MRAGRILHNAKAGLIWVIAALVIAVALAVTALRFAMPLADQYRDEIQVWVGDALGTRLRIGSMRARWGLGAPVLTLEQVDLFAADREGAALRVDRLDLRLDVPASLRDGFPRLASVLLSGVRLRLHRGRDGRVAVRGWASDGGGAIDLGWALTPTSIRLREVEIEWYDEPLEETWRFSGLSAVLDNDAGRHRFSLRATPDSGLARELRFGAEFATTGRRPGTLDADLYLKVQGFRPAAWSPRWLRPETLHRGLDVALWVQRRAGDWSDVRGEARGLAVRLPRVDLTPEQPRIELPLRFAWTRDAAGWRLRVEAPESARRDAGYRLSVRYTDGPAPRLRLAADHLPVAAIAALMTASELVPEPMREVLEGRSLDADDLSVRLDTGIALDDPHLELSARGLASQPDREGPGVVDLDVVGELDLRPSAADPRVRRGRLRLAVDGGHLQLPGLFREPLPPVEARVDLELERRRGQWRATTRTLTLRNEDLALDLKGSVRLSAEGGPRVDARLELKRFDVARLSRYLPARRMPATGVRWLDRAIVAGRVESGEVVLVGDLDHFPFREGEGIFEAGVRLTDAILDYTPGWPRIEGLDAELRTTARGLAVSAGAGTILDSSLRKVEARVDLRKPGRVWVEGSVDLPAEDIPELILDSPLASRFGAYVRDLGAEGAARLRLELEMPLPVRAPQDVRTEGRLSLRDADLHWRSPPLSLNGVEGGLHFSNHGLWGRDIEASLGPLPGRLEIDSRDPQGTLLRFIGRLDDALVDRFLTSPWRDRIRGGTEWRVWTRLPKAPDPNAELPLRLTSDLRGLRFDLPEPFGKSADRARTLTVATTVQAGRTGPIRVSYQGVLDAVLRLGKGNVPERGEVVLGTGRAKLPEASGVRVRGRLPSLSVDAWSRLLAGTEAGTGSGSAAPWLTRLKGFELSTPRLTLLGQTLSQAWLKATPRDQGWDLRIDSPAMAGELWLPDDLDAAPVTADLERAHVVRGEGKQGAPLDPRRLPALRWHIRDFRFNDIEFGELDLEAKPDPKGIRLERLRIRSKRLTVDAQGSWIRDTAGDLSSFDIDFESPALGRTLTALGYADTLEEGKTNGRISGFWRGAPGDFALERLNGDLRLHVEHGRILGIDPGVGRVFGLLSLQTLPRRLALDFSDLYKKGLPFDRIDGSFVLEDGDAVTHDLVLEGPVTNIQVDGRIGLAARDYDQVVTVEPAVSDSLGLAGAAGAAAAVSLGAGAAVLLAHRLLEPQLNRIARIEYLLQGPWDRPRITPVQRGSESVEAALPDLEY